MFSVAVWLNMYPNFSAIEDLQYVDHDCWMLQQQITFFTFRSDVSSNFEIDIEVYGLVSIWHNSHYIFLVCRLLAVNKVFNTLYIMF